MRQGDDFDWLGGHFAGLMNALHPLPQHMPLLKITLYSFIRPMTYASYHRFFSFSAILTISLIVLAEIHMALFRENIIENDQFS